MAVEEGLDTGGIYRCVEVDIVGAGDDDRDRPPSDVKTAAENSRSVELV